MQTSSVEIERVCDRADESVLETAAVSVAPVNRGPEQLVIFVVLKKGYDSKAEKLKTKFSKAIQSNLNPLYKVWLHNLFFVQQTLNKTHIKLWMNEFNRWALWRLFKNFLERPRTSCLGEFWETKSKWSFLFGVEFNRTTLPSFLVMYLFELLHWLWLHIALRVGLHRN